MKLIEMPAFHVIRITPFKELLKQFPQLRTPNDLLTMDFVHAKLPPRDTPIVGLLSQLPMKHPMRNQPLNTLREVATWSPRDRRWRKLRTGDKRGTFSYNELPALQQYLYVWKALP